MASIKGLTSEQSGKLQDTVRQRESGGDYQAENKYGYVGGYQFGAQALQDQGLLRPGVVTDFAKLGNTPTERAAAHKELLNNPNNWTIPGGKEAYLNNPQLQDQSFQKLANKNYDYLSKKGVIDGNSDAGDVGGYLTAAHLKGASNAAKLANGEVTRDANGTSTAEYFKLGKTSVTGAAGGPPPKVSGSAGASSGKTPSNVTVTTGVGKQFTTTTQRQRQRDIVEDAGVVTNVLEQFTSFNCIFTLSCLSDAQINFPDAPDSYKSGNLGQIILRGGSGLPSERVSTAYTSTANPGGKFEFYIDNVVIESIMSFNKRSKGTNSTELTFDVFEPYSMGLFLQTLQIAAASQGYKNYIEAPFLLTMQFIGRNDSGDVVMVDDTLDRHIPIKFSNANMTVTASGCTYNVEAYPWNEQAFVDTYNLLKEDLNVSGTDIAQILQTGPQSLQSHLNKRLEEMAKQGSETGQTTYTRDEIVILFPTSENIVSGNTPNGGGTDSEASATASPGESSKNRAVETKLSINRGSNNILSQDEASLNPIGQSKMGFDATTGGESAPVDAQTAQPDGKKAPKRAASTIDHKNKSFRFTQGTSIINAISEIVVMSEYCKKSVAAPSDSRGFKPWFRVEGRVYNLAPTEGNDKKARIPKLIVYNVVEYDVHESRFLAPTSEPAGIDNLKKSVVKEYNYIYSGKNVDILNFNIKLDQSVFTTVYSDKMALASSAYNQMNGQGVPEGNSQPTSNNDAPTNTYSEGVAREGDLHKRETTSGGGPSGGYRELVAKNFQESLLNSPADLITAEMEVLGDPYYIADSGMGNFGSKLAAFNINENGSMNYQSGEVDIIVNFKTPIDYDPETGYMDFGTTVNVDGFSGLYQVLGVKNQFVKGKFTQLLDLVRRKNQTPATEPAGTRGADSAANGSDTSSKDDGASATRSSTAPKTTSTDTANNGDGASQVVYTDSGIPLY